MTLNFLTLRAPAADTTITWKHIVDDYGATPGGSGTATGDYTAFKAFRDWAVEQSGWVGLMLPPSTGAAYYGCNGSYAAAGEGGWPPAITNTPFFGIPKLIVNGYAANGQPGAKVTGLFGGSMVNTNVYRSLIRTVEAGSAVLELIDEEDADLYAVGNMILLAGLDLQGFGYPPNSHYNEWHRIASIDGASITLEKPIKYHYSENWPTYFVGNQFELGGFGAASINRTIPGWDCEHRLYGLESLDEGQTYYFVRKAQIVDCKQTGGGFIIGASADHRIINQQHTTSGMEVDKLTIKGLIDGYGPADKQIIVQSSSVDDLEIRNSTRIINGTAKHTRIISGDHPSIGLGPSAYGISESIEIRDTVFNAITGAPGGMYQLLGDDLSYEGDGVFHYSGSGPSQFLIPGAVCCLQGGTSGGHRYRIFRVLSIEAGDGYVIVNTTLTGETLPTLNGGAITPDRVVRHNAPNLTVINCTGSPEALELSLAPPNSPFGIITRRTYTASPFQANGTTGGYVLGKLVHLKINVEQAYTGAQSNLLFKLGQFGSPFKDASDNIITTHLRVNCKIAGERIITPSGVAGVQSGDVNLSDIAGDFWFSGHFLGAFFGADTNGSSAVNVASEADGVRPIVTVEMLTDQEFT
jgi:hypothetical protein